MKVKIGGVLQHDHLARISVLGMPGRQGTAAALLKAFGAAGISGQFIAQCLDQRGEEHLIVCIERDELEQALDSIGRIQAELCAATVSYDPYVASLSIFGPDFRVRPGIAGVMFDALKRAGIPLHAISTSISTVTVIIAADRLAGAVEVIRQTFELPG